MAKRSLRKSTTLSRPALPLQEEDAIALMPDLSEIRKRSIGRVGDEYEPCSYRCPRDSRAVLNVAAGEAPHPVTNLCALLYALPMNMEGNVRRDGRTSLQGIGKSAIVCDILIVEVHGSRGAIQVDCDALIGDAYRPKHASRTAGGAVGRCSCRCPSQYLRGPQHQ